MNPDPLLASARENLELRKELAEKIKVLKAYDAVTNALPRPLAIVIMNAHPPAYRGEPLSEAELAKQIEAVNPLAAERDALKAVVERLVSQIRTVRIDRKSDDGEFTLQTTEWSHWLLDEANKAIATIASISAPKEEASK